MMLAKSDKKLYNLGNNFLKKISTSAKPVKSFQR